MNYRQDCMLPLTSQHEKNTTESVAVTSKPLVVRALLVHWYGDINWNVYRVWILYHYRRWNVTKIEFYLHESVIPKAKEVLRDIDHVKIYYHAHRLTEFDGKFQRQLFNEALHNAKVDGDDILINLDADEFLTSKHFKSFEDILEATNNKAAVSFPTFTVKYRICSSADQVFGSITYSNLAPAKSTLKDNRQGKEYYVPSLPGCGGQRKFFVQPAMWDTLGHVHDPIDCRRNETSPLVHDFTGYETPSGDLHLHHIKFQKGIHAEIDGIACSRQSDCEFLGSNDVCLQNRTKAESMKVDSVFAPYSDLAQTKIYSQGGSSKAAESRRLLRH